MTKDGFENDTILHTPTAEPSAVLYTIFGKQMVKLPNKTPFSVPHVRSRNCYMLKFGIRMFSSNIYQTVETVEILE